MSQLKWAPFGRLSGKISPLAGQGEFAELTIHRKLLDTIIKRSRKPTSFWLLGGTLGSGKTWTLSWLLRDGPSLLTGKTKSEWAMVGFTFLPRGAPDRVFFESFFSASNDLRAHIREWMLRSGELVTPKTSHSRAVRAALSNYDIWGTLCGHSSSFPRKRGVPKLPSWSSPANRLGIFLAFLSMASDAGISNLMIIVDEFEAAVTTSGSGGLGKLSHFFRQLHDELGTGTQLPRTQIILSATLEVVLDFVPSPEAAPATKVKTPNVLVQALRERMDPPFFLDVFTKRDALLLADLRIGAARMAKTNRKYIPYDENAIVLAYESCLLNIRNFVTSLEAMYEEALAMGVSYIDHPFARRVLRARGLAR